MKLMDRKTLDRRKFLQLSARAAVLSAIAGPAQHAWAQSYPTRPVRIISPYAPGGATDIIARLIAQWLTERLGKAFIVENRPGGATNIGTEAVVRSAPDGYTLLLASSANAVNATLYQKLSFNFLRDTVPVASIGGVPNIIIVRPQHSAQTVSDFIAYLKANPQKVNFGLPGIGSPQHLSAELFKLMVGVDPVFVQYRGGAPVLNDLIGGHVEASFSSTVASAEYIKSGTLRGLAVTSATRSDAFPDIPALAEVIPGYEATNFYGIAAPKGVPADIVGLLNKEINAGLADSKLKAQLATLGITTHSMTPDEFASHIAAETEKWGKVVKSADLKPD
jgi:tripartite-type tricarboxylate transporter receptor subunit TctC